MPKLRRPTRPSRPAFLPPDKWSIRAGPPNSAPRSMRSAPRLPRLANCSASSPRRTEGISAKPGGNVMRLAKLLIVSALAISAIAVSALPSTAQSWPTRPVRMLLPLGAGSGADIGARLIADKLAIRWGQPVVVENRPGGDGFVAITAFVAARDDHLLFFGPAASFTAHPYLHEKLPYDPRDLAPAARVSATLVSLTTPPQINVNSLGELLAMARAQPGKLNWASVTGATDLVIAAFLKREGLDIAKIPYRDPV